MTIDDDPINDMTTGEDESTLAFNEGYARGYNEGYSAGQMDTRKHLTTTAYCGKTDGAEVCDRMKGHAGDCSWRSDIVQTNMARQLTELHGWVKAAFAMVPPGMLPPELQQ